MEHININNVRKYIGALCFVVNIYAFSKLFYVKFIHLYIYTFIPAGGVAGQLTNSKRASDIKVKALSASNN